MHRFFNNPNKMKVVLLIKKRMLMITFIHFNMKQLQLNDNVKFIKIIPG